MRAKILGNDEKKKNCFDSDFRFFRVSRGRSALFFAGFSFFRLINRRQIFVRFLSGFADIEVKRAFRPRHRIAGQNAADSLDAADDPLPDRFEIFRRVVDFRRFEFFIFLRHSLKFYNEKARFAKSVKRAFLQTGDSRVSAFVLLRHQILQTFAFFADPFGIFRRAVENRRAFERLERAARRRVFGFR